MKLDQLKVCVLFLLALLWAAGCATGTSPRGEWPPEVARRKLLERQSASFPQRQFFVGTGEAQSLDQGTKEAYQEITQQLTWLPLGSQDLLLDLYRAEHSLLDNKGNVHVLAVLEREAAAAHLRRLAMENEARGRRELEGCRQHFKGSELPKAQDCLAKTNEIFSRARDLFAAAQKTVGDNAQPAADTGDKAR